MKKTENTYDRQTAKFIATLCQSIPDMSGDVMQGWIENPKALQKTLAEAITPPLDTEVKTEAPSLRNLDLTLSVPAQPECKVANCFTDTAVFAYRDSDFDNWLPATLPASAEVAVNGYELTKTTTEETLSKVGRPFTNLTQIEDLIRRTKRGENTGLITDGCANIFFLQVGKSVSVVLASRCSDGWHVRYFRFCPMAEWSAGLRCFALAT